MRWPFVSRKKHRDEIASYAVEIERAAKYIKELHKELKRVPLKIYMAPARFDSLNVEIGLRHYIKRELLSDPEMKKIISEEVSGVMAETMRRYILEYKETP